MANSVEPDQTTPIVAVCSGSTLFASILNLSVMLGNYLQQTTSADDIFRSIYFLAALRVNHQYYTVLPKASYCKNGQLICSGSSNLCDLNLIDYECERIYMGINDRTM